MYTIERDKIKINNKIKWNIRFIICTSLVSEFIISLPFRTIYQG